MTWVTTRRIKLACSRCGSPVGQAAYRFYPPKLELSDFTGAVLGSDRAGRVLHQLESGAMSAGRVDDTDLRRWLNSNALELAYYLSCPEHGRMWALSPDIATAIRRAGRGTGWVQIPTH